jgi:hypothetical protein
VPPLGRQARGHIERANKWLGEAKVAARLGRGRCSIALPNLLKAQDALGQAWAHIESISVPRAGVKKKRLDVIERARREKVALSDRHHEIKTEVARGIRAFEGRCLIK